MIKKLVLGICLSVGLTVSAQAQIQNAENSIYNLIWQVGPSTHLIKTSNAVIRIEDNEAFLQGKEAWEFMRLTEGHDRIKPDALVLKTNGPLANSVVIFQYTGIGFVKMDDWERNIDPDKIIRLIRKSTQKANEIRSVGHEKLYVDGWIEKPYLDRQNAIVYWAIRGHSENGKQFVNAKAIKLGRKGISTLLWIGSPGQFQGTTQNLQSALAAYKYRDGFRYADFRSGVDTVAAVGVGAIAYKMLTGRGAKTSITAGTGLLALVAAFAKKLWFLVLLAFVISWNAIKNLFSRN